MALQADVHAAEPERRKDGSGTSSTSASTSSSAPVPDLEMDLAKRMEECRRKYETHGNNLWLSTDLQGCLRGRCATCDDCPAWQCERRLIVWSPFSGMPPSQCPLIEHYAADNNCALCGCPVESHRNEEEWFEKVCCKMKQMRKRSPKQSPTSSKNLLPAAALEWDALDVAFIVLSNGLFDPFTREQRRIEQMSRGFGDSDLPLVSICVPTSARRLHFHELLLQNFDHQSYPNVELVVLQTEGSASPVLEEKARRDPRVFYQHFPKASDMPKSRAGPHGYNSQQPCFNPFLRTLKWTLGFKRNLCAHFATGDVIVHFDDDDLYAPNYIQHMFDTLRELVLTYPTENEKTAWQNMPAVATLAEWHCYDFGPDRFRWLAVETCATVRPEWQAAMIYGYGFKYMYTKAAWDYTSFPDLQEEEDDFFMQDFRQAFPDNVKVAKVPGAPRRGLVAHSLHSDCSSGGEFNGSQRCGVPCRVPEGLESSHHVARQVRHPAAARPVHAHPLAVQPSLPPKLGPRTQQLLERRRLQWHGR
mmetsp:Transcript_47153/g.112212  ORF Transcript_47153/g.112212 Transcript_47153/m.112212 type:complete len:531 (-) Transcript_47153:168-1760(-)